MKIDPRRSEAFVAAIDSGSLEQAAAQLHITPAYAKKLVSRCLRQARERYGKDRK